jgi:hypothetical protein
MRQVFYFEGIKEYLTRKFLTALGIDGWRRLLRTVSAGKEVCAMRIYKVRVFFPGFYPIKAKDDAEALEKVVEFYKRLYKREFREMVEPLPEPEDFK